MKFDPSHTDENNLIPKPSFTRSSLTSAVPPVVLLFRARFLARPVQQKIAEEASDLPLSLCAAEPTKNRRPSLSRRQPRLGAGGPRRRLKFTAKRLGEIAEAFFLAKAADLGFTVLKPWGDSEAYDFVLDAHHGARGFSRVQVKSSNPNSKTPVSVRMTR